MTTTGETPRVLPLDHPGPLPLSDFPTRTRIDTTDVQDPFRQWLEANGISMDRIVMWPELEVGEDTIRVESFTFTGGSATMLYDHTYTRLRTYPMLVKPSYGLVEAYQYQRAQALADRMLERLGKAGATVVRPETGSKLMFVTRDRLEPAALDRMRGLLMQGLPGVDVWMVSGVDTIVHGAP